ncbi:MAG: response regulator transcription factor [Bacteroidota bacterium]
MLVSPIQIAIVDDQKLFLKGLKLILSSFEDIELTLEAKDGEQLLHALKKNQPDVILMDLKMPKIGGIEAIKIIDSLYPSIKVIVLSMYDEERLINHTMKSGANSYLLKNEEPEVLHKAIRTVYEKDYYFTDYVSKALLKGQPIINGQHLLNLEISTRIGITKRELEILNLICNELTTAEIAKKLFISKRTVEGHRKNLLAKTGVKNTVGLVLFAIRNQLVDVSNSPIN